MEVLVAIVLHTFGGAGVLETYRVLFFFAFDVGVGYCVSSVEVRRGEGGHSCCTLGYESCEYD